MDTPPLPAELTRDVLRHLGVTATKPDLSLLDALFTAYTRTIPWETAFRIARRSQTTITGDCPRWPDVFWRDALERGGGGTCFESNYAFYSLLLALGYTGYLTINNMEDSIGCHTAIVLTINEERWLADVGIPLYCPLPLNHQAVTRRSSPFQQYTIRPDGENRFQVERSPHPKPNIFTLIDVPVSDAAYRAATTADYGADGLFLDKIIVSKIIAGKPWYFNNQRLPFHLESFQDGERTDHPLNGDIPGHIAQHFSLAADVLRIAWDAVEVE